MATEEQQERSIGWPTGTVEGQNTGGAIWD